MLSKVQQEVLSKMKLGVYLWTDEGANYTAWLGDSNGAKIESVNRRTAESLANKKEIEFIDGNYRHGLFKYKKKGSMEIVECEECGGGGFSKPGTGYDAVCDKCAGQGQHPA